MTKNITIFYFILAAQLLVSCSSSPNRRNPSSCKIEIQTDAKRTDSTALHRIPSAPGVYQHEGVWCSKAQLQAYKRFGSMSATDEPWIFYLYGDHSNNGAVISLSFYPEKGGEKDKRAVKSTIKYSGELCDFLMESTQTLRKIEFKKNRIGTLTMSCK